MNRYFIVLWFFVMRDVDLRADVVDLTGLLIKSSSFYVACVDDCHTSDFLDLISRQCRVVKARYLKQDSVIPQHCQTDVPKAKI
jgi:hypothetical protein